jgi:uncharacterized protein YabE (DUF348 family)
VRYGLFGVVLAGLVVGAAAWLNVDKTVRLVVDGHARSVHTTAESVGQVVRGAGYEIGAHDILAPAAGADVHDGSTIIYKRGRLLELNVDGKEKKVWTTAPTVAVALRQLGYSSRDFVSVSRSKRLPLRPTDLTVRTPKAVTVVYDAKRQLVSTTDLTVGELVTELDITIDADDRISLPLETALQPGLTIVIQHVRHATTVATRTLAFHTKIEHDASLLTGKSKIVNPGHKGLEKITYAVVYVDGKLVTKNKIKAQTVRKAAPRVKKVGTKPEPVAQSPESGSSGSGSAPAGDSGGSTSSGHIASPSEAKAIARTMLAARGWSDQYSCLAALWGKESAWRVTAANPSGAYGIPQALPGSKMGPGWRTSAKVQISWGLSYIADRYDTPCGAWSYWQSHNYY